MNAYPDTSFLFAFYVKQTNSPDAAALAKSMTEPLHVTSLLQYEFRHGLRFQVWRHGANPREGIALTDAEKALKQFESDLTSGLAVLVACDYAQILQRGDDLSGRHAMANGHRSFDILHVATALHLGAKEFLTFDANQRKLALAEKLKVKP